MEDLHRHKRAQGTNKIQRGSNHQKQREKQQGIYHRLIRRMCLNCVGSTGVSTPDDLAKSKPIAGSVVQRDHKIEIQRTG